MRDPTGRQAGVGHAQAVVVAAVVLATLLVLAASARHHRPPVPTASPPPSPAVPLPSLERLLAPGVGYSERELAHGHAHVITLLAPEGARLRPWLGRTTVRKLRAARQLAEVAEAEQAICAMNASFFYQSPVRGDAMILGHVVQGGRSAVSPNPDILFHETCYLAQLADGTFHIGATRATTARLLRALPDAAALIGGNGWLIEAGDATAYRRAPAQGFGGDVWDRRCARTVAGTRRDGQVAWLATMDGKISLQEAAELLEDLGAWDGLFFDGGGSSELCIPVLPQATETLNAHRDGPMRPVPVALLVEGGAP